MTLDIPYPEINTDGRAISTEQINEYLYKLAQSLEFSLSDISLDNLSKELLEMIGVGVSEETVEQYATDALRNANSFTRRLVNEAKQEMKEYVNENGGPGASYKFSINFETGNLEYEKEEA